LELIYQPEPPGYTSNLASDAIANKQIISDGAGARAAPMATGIEDALTMMRAHAVISAGFGELGRLKTDKSQQFLSGLAFAQPGQS
jgi:hypothetical protein